jgi:LysM repeat protein
MDNTSHRARLAGYAILLLLAAVLALGFRGVVSSGLAEAEESTNAIAGVDPDTVVEGEALSLEDGSTLPVIAVAGLPVIQDTSLSPNANPATFQGKKPEHEFQTYVVERGDTPNGIAEKFGLETTTLLGGNPSLSQESSLLQTGVELIILPIDGVLHDVQPGDTLESISAEYGIPFETIVGYAPNNLEFPYRLYPETQILVPGAVRDVFVWTPPSLESVRRPSGSGVAPAIVGTGTFIYPVNSRNYTQYYWYGHPGLDIALGEGSAVVASDTGTVTFAGWNIHGYGYLIVVNHGNGYETFYAHLSGINVVPGQIVYQGNVIGATGNTGNSSGPHIHFEIRTNGAQDNPCWYIGGC